MKVRELLKLEIDIDVYDNVCEELGIAFCGPVELTKEGREHFRESLEYDVELDNIPGPYAGIIGVVDIDCDEWEEKLKKAKELFYSMAGYCSVSEYEKWFK